MKNICRTLCLFAFTLTACTPTRTAAPTLAPTATLTIPAPSRTLPSSATPPPSQTPALPTITPLPTIPTLTPTFDTRVLVTATRPAAAECPAQSATAGKFAIPSSTPNRDQVIWSPDYATHILAYLNSGGKMNDVARELDRTNASNQLHGYGEYHIQDVTGDGVADMLFLQPGQIDTAPIVFLCSQGSYISLTLQPKKPYLLSVQFEGAVDLNADGIAEIIVNSSFCGGTKCGERVDTFGWNGQTFQPYSDFMDYIYTISFRDADHNGTTDIVALVQGNPGGSMQRSQYLPKRHHNLIYGWNGSDMVQIDDIYDPPNYRFQALQDADHFALTGKYAEAFKIYKEVIASASLGWWTPERAEYVRLDEDVFNNVLGDPAATPYPTPVIDKTEYPRLAAYANYRMMALHFYLSQVDNAQKDYATLQANFPADNPAHLYAEMAAAFFDSYQSTQKMYNACAAAIAYADSHPEILTPLGSDYHGWQSHTYTPADVCPFR